MRACVHACVLVCAERACVRVRVPVHIGACARRLFNFIFFGIIALLDGGKDTCDLAHDTVTCVALSP